MKERPINFRDWEVRALLAGAKTVTRRPVWPANSKRDLYPQDAVHWWEPCREPGNEGRWSAKDGIGGIFHIPCPFGVPGDRLWVRETIKATPGHPGSGQWRISYAADDAGVNLSLALPGDKRLRYSLSRQTIPSATMPRWASRLTLEVASVRIERLQEIGDEDLDLFGIRCHNCNGFGTVRAHGFFDDCPDDRCGDPAALCRSQWEADHGKRHPWDSNPWVWRVEHRRVDS